MKRKIAGFFVCIFLVILIYNCQRSCDISFLSVSGNIIVNEKGEEARLRGVQLDFGSARGDMDLINESDVRQNDFFDEMLDYVVTEDDFADLKSMGANSARFSLNTYMDFETEPFIYSQENFERLDRVIAWAEEYNIYLILSMRQSPGGHNNNAHSGNNGLNELWSNVTNQERIAELWKQIALRYADKPIIAGFDLLNEPEAPNRTILNKVYLNITETIRDVDNRHIIFLEKNLQEDLDWIDPPLDTNTLLSIHFYVPWDYAGVGDGRYPSTGFDKDALKQALIHRINYAATLNLPVHVGEFGAVTKADNYLDYDRDIIDLLEEQNTSWGYWNYKNLRGIDTAQSIYYMAPGNEFLNLIDRLKAGESFSNFSEQDLQRALKSLKTSIFCVKTDLKNLLKESFDCLLTYFPIGYFGVRCRRPFSDATALVSELGAEWATTDFHTSWNDLEPEKGTYIFDKMDSQIKGLQNLGLQPYVILSCCSKWGTESIEQGDDRTMDTALPDPEDIEAWKDFVRYFVERYDCDGTNDMPGLLNPAHYFQISEEWPTSWHKAGGFDNVKDYIELIKITSEAAKQANPNVKIATAGLTSGYRFLVYADDYITDSDGGLYRGTYFTPNEIKTHSIYNDFNTSIRYMIENGGDYFDIYTIHAFEEKDTFLDGKIKWLKDRFIEYGYADKQVLLSAGHGPFTNTQEEMDCMDEHCNILPNCTEADHYDGDCSFGPWTYRKHAEYVVKIYTTATANDVPGPPWLLGSEKVIPNPNQPWNGPFVHNPFVNGATGKKPGFYTYKIMIAKIKGFSSVEELDYGDSKVYKYILNNKPVVIAWNNDGSIIDLSQHFSTPNVTITYIVTGLDENNDPIYLADEIVSADPIVIDESPVFIEESQANGITKSQKIPLGLK